MEPITLEKKDHKFHLTIDDSIIDRESLVQFIERLHFEYLIRKAKFDEDIEGLGQEIKSKWWEENKMRLLGDALLKP
ncbi:MAG TPA: hypothetical protein VE978_03035 [Chitinophagales bacterium]|nr:hypothetical protein [Chitinophagales bacterium]